VRTSCPTQGSCFWEKSYGEVCRRLDCQCRRIPRRRLRVNNKRKEVRWHRLSIKMHCANANRFPLPFSDFAPSPQHRWKMKKIKISTHVRMNQFRPMHSGLQDRDTCYPQNKEICLLSVFQCLTSIKKYILNVSLDGEQRSELLSFWTLFIVWNSKC
jgi:hypothetical protein